MWINYPQTWIKSTWVNYPQTWINSHTKTKKEKYMDNFIRYFFQMQLDLLLVFICMHVSMYVSVILLQCTVYYFSLFFSFFRIYTYCPRDVCNNSVTRVLAPGHVQLLANKAYLNSSSHTTCSANLTWSLCSGLYERKTTTTEMITMISTMAGTTHTYTH